MHRVEKPTKADLRKVAKLAEIIDFTKQKLLPFAAIAREAVRKRIIAQSETASLYHSFTRVNKYVQLFEGQFFPADQTPTGKSRWEWKTPRDMTATEFLGRIEDYAKKNFKTPL